MAKTRGKSNLGGTSEDEQFKKLSLKEQGEDIGEMPDEEDYQNLRRLIDDYNRVFPGRIKKMQEQIKVENALSGKNKYGELSDESEMRYIFSIPEELQPDIEQGYPSFWTNKKHAMWFVKRFPEFKRSDKV